MFIDTHCHLNFKVFRPRVGEVVARAREAGVEQMVVVGTNLKTSARAVKIATQQVNLWATIGVHPHHVWDYLVKAEQQSRVTGEEVDQLLDVVLEKVRLKLSELIDQPRVVALGEIGLDYHFYEQTQYENKAVTDVYKQWQRTFFGMQAKLAVEHNKAVVIHNREAVTDLLEWLKQEPAIVASTRVVLHCCEPDSRLLEWVLAGEKRWLGVDGDVTFDQKKREFVAQVPLDRLVLETDAPYITPEPDRLLFAQQKDQKPYYERVCEPRHVAIIAEKVAEIKGVSVEEIARVTTENAGELFGIV